MMETLLFGIRYSLILCTFAPALALGPFVYRLGREIFIL